MSIGLLEREVWWSSQCATPLLFLSSLLSIFPVKSIKEYRQKEIKKCTSLKKTNIFLNLSIFLFYLLRNILYWFIISYAQDNLRKSKTVKRNPQIKRLKIVYGTTLKRSLVKFSMCNTAPLSFISFIDFPSEINKQI